MTKLEDLLLPDNLRVKKKEFQNEIDSFIEKNFIEPGLDAIIDDGGISGRPLSIEEIMELESRNYPNAAIDETPYLQIYRGFKIVKNGNIYEIDHDDERMKGWHEEITGLRNLIDDFFQEDEEHYVDHEAIEERNHQIWVNEVPTFNDEIGDEDYHLKSEPDGLDNLIERMAEVERNKSPHLEQLGGNELPDYLINDPEIVGYPDEEMQWQIYNWVAEKINYSDEFSVKDFGCGRGDFYKLIQTWTAQYTGIDSNPNLIQVGKQKYKDITLINDDFLKVDLESDYSICIGTLNDDHGFDKWEYFNKTLNHALSNTKRSIIFVLSANMDDLGGFLDYPIHEMVERLDKNLRWQIDYSKFEDIYLLTVDIGGWSK